jgi:periplasmic protein TonB
MSDSKIVDLVFTRRSPKASRRIIIAALLAIGTHAALVGWAMSIPEPPPAKPKLKEYLVELEEPAKPAPLPEQTPTPEPAPVTPVEPSPMLTKIPLQKTPAPPNVVPSKEPPPPAQAGNVVAQEPDANAPVDLSDNTFITGESKAFAGGTTTTKGTNDKAVYTKDTDPNGKPGGQVLAAPLAKPKGLDRSRPVALNEDSWACAWPREADSEQIDEQSVTLKVSVDAKGKVTAANLISDPGHGFGAAALACALKTRFTPALDASGKAILSISPSIRVRFMR